MRSDPKRVGHVEEREKKEAKGHSALSEELKQESHSAIMRKTQVRASRGAVQKGREKYNESVRE